MATHEVEKWQKSPEKNEKYSEKSRKPRETAVLVGSPCAMLKPVLGGTTADPWEGGLGPTSGAGVAWEEEGRGKMELPSGSGERSQQTLLTVGNAECESKRRTASKARFRLQAMG